MQQVWKPIPQKPACASVIASTLQTTAVRSTQTRRTVRPTAATARRGAAAPGAVTTTRRRCPRSTRRAPRPSAPVPTATVTSSSWWCRVSVRRTAPVGAERGTRGHTGSHRGHTGVTPGHNGSQRGHNGISAVHRALTLTAATNGLRVS